MPVFDNCNVCGKRLRTEEEESMGMCEHCAYDWQDDFDFENVPDEDNDHA